EGLPGWAKATEADMERGFLIGLRGVGISPFIEQGAELLARLPVRRVKFDWEGGGATRRLAGCPALARLSEIDLGNGHLDGVELGLLLPSPYLGRLESLLLHNNQLGSGGAVVLARSRAVPALRELYLPGNGIGDEGAAALGEVTAPHGLEVLDLRDNRVGDRG